MRVGDDHLWCTADLSLSRIGGQFKQYFQRLPLNVCRMVERLKSRRETIPSNDCPAAEEMYAVGGQSAAKNVLFLHVATTITGKLEGFKARSSP